MLRNRFVSVVVAGGSSRCFATPHKAASSPQQQRTGSQQQPSKDRFPPKSYNPTNPARRLAVLVDASKVTAESFVRHIEPAVCKVGYPILVRVFDHQLKSDWNALVAGSSNSITSLLESADSPLPLSNTVRAQNASLKRQVENPAVMEFFRVEKFIPVSMQLGADANHLFQFRQLNMTQGICYVCTQLERPLFEKYMDRLKGQGFNQYSFDEAGLGIALEEDGRSVRGD